MLGYSKTASSIPFPSINSDASEKANILLSVTPEVLRTGDGPGVGKLLVGPNGPVDANAAAKVAAAGTMPNISAANSEIVPINTPKRQPPPSHVHQVVTKQCVLRCDCCSISVNSQHQLDLHLNGTNNYYKLSVSNNTL